MQIGFLVINLKYAESIFELADASLVRGHSIRIFMTDEGVKLIENKKMHNYAPMQKTHISFCSHSAKNHNINTSMLPEGISPSTQYQNALMHNECDRVLVF
ncbi:MAG: DsrE family protein [Nitrospirae bacterium]|nr:DsrE family protein [Nitrospirota bacterium]